MMSRSARERAKIAFDTWVLGRQAVHQGVQVYAKKLLSHFTKIASDYAVEIAAYVSRSDHGADFSSQFQGYRRQPTALLSHSRLWRYGGASVLASFGNSDLVFNPHCATWYDGSLVPSVTTIHDAIPSILPWRARETKLLRFLTWSAAKRSRALITVSECSKADLIRLYDLPDPNVHVIYNGCDHDVFNDAPVNRDRLQQTLKKHGIHRSYVLHYGSIKPNKNLKRLVQAYSRVLERDSDLELDLVLAGLPGPAYAEVVESARHVESSRGQVVFTGALEQSDLVLLLKGASLAIFPSLYEGFCLPMVESMACGVPVIAANSSCLREISGDVLAYFNPESVPEMAACMEAALKSWTLRRELAKKGHARAGFFDWQRCAEETLEVLTRVAHGEAA